MIVVLRLHESVVMGNFFFNTIKEINTPNDIKKKFSDDIMRGSLDRIYGLEISNIIPFDSDKTRDVEWLNFIRDKYVVIVGVTLKANVWICQQCCTFVYFCHSGSRFPLTVN